MGEEIENGSDCEGENVTGNEEGSENDSEHPLEAHTELETEIGSDGGMASDSDWQEVENASGLPYHGRNHGEVGMMGEVGADGCRTGCPLAKIN